MLRRLSSRWVRCWVASPKLVLQFELEIGCKRCGCVEMFGDVDEGLEVESEVRRRFVHVPRCEDYVCE